MTFLTIAAKNYLAFARVLFESIARHHPESRRVLVLADEPDGCFDPKAEPFEVIRSGELGIGGIEWLRFKYSILELSTALKPFAIERLLADGTDTVVYVDPDIRFYQRLEIPAGALILTPHLLERVDDNGRPDEIDILRSGVFNLGFAAVRTEAVALLAWWRDRVREQCWADHAAGLFVDQKWMDLAPALFGGVTVVRDPRWNVAYWNIRQRPDVDPVFLHFSGFDPADPEPFARHQNRVRLSTLPEAMRERAVDYAAALDRAGFGTCRQWPYTWGSFANGDPIGPYERLAWRQNRGQFAAIADPFGDECRAAALLHWREERRLERHLWESRHDWERWPYPGESSEAYGRWLAGQPAASLGLTPALHALLGEGGPRSSRSAADAYARGEIGEEELLRLAVEYRADLTAIASNRTELLHWLLSGGAREIGLSEDRLEPFRVMWRQAIADEPLGGLRRRLYLLARKVRASVST